MGSGEHPQLRWRSWISDHLWRVCRRSQCVFTRKDSNKDLIMQWLGNYIVLALQTALNKDTRVCFKDFFHIFRFFLRYPQTCFVMPSQRAVRQQWMLSWVLTLCQQPKYISKIHYNFKFMIFIYYTVSYSFLIKMYQHLSVVCRKCIWLWYFQHKEDCWLCDAADRRGHLEDC